MKQEKLVIYSVHTNIHRRSTGISAVLARKYCLFGICMKVLVLRVWYVTSWWEHILAERWTFSLSSTQMIRCANRFEYLDIFRFLVGDTENGILTLFVFWGGLWNFGVWIFLVLKKLRVSWWLCNCTVPDTCWLHFARRIRRCVEAGLKSVPDVGKALW